MIFFSESVTAQIKIWDVRERCSLLLDMRVRACVTTTQVVVILLVVIVIVGLCGRQTVVECIND